MAESKPAPGDTILASLGGTDGIPGGTNSIPGILSILGRLIVSPGGTSAFPGGLSIPEGLMASLGNQWRLGCPSAQRGFTAPSQPPPSSKGPQDRAGVQVALAEHWDCHSQTRPYKTHPSTRADGSQGRGEAEGNYPSRDLHRPRRLETTIIWPWGLFWRGGGCPAPSRATPG